MVEVCVENDTVVFALGSRDARPLTCGSVDIDCCVAYLAGNSEKIPDRLYPFVARLVSVLSF